MHDESSHPLRRIVELLQRHGVEFLIIGGQAENLMGSPRVTYDVDICYRRTPGNIRRLAQALGELEVRLRDAPPDLPFRPDERTLSAGLNFTLDTNEGPLDLIGEVEPIGPYEKLLPHSEEYDVWRLRIRTISLDDLIRVKRHIGRPKDSESLNQLLAIRRVRAEGGGA
jgi:predicted nucleotidyltransferase